MSNVSESQLVRDWRDRLGRMFDSAPDSPSSLPEPIEVQTVKRDLSNHFADVTLLARGGQSLVFQATEPRTGELLAVKVPIHSALFDEQNSGRLKREIELIANVNHPNIVRLRGAQSLADRTALVMDYILGVPIDVYVLAQGLNVEQTCRLLLKVLDAVNFAHSRGVVHRDLKPTNILIDETGEPKVLDFGLARLIDPVDDQSTAAGGIVGTFPYSSPEQRLPGAQADIRSDIYALGITLYQLLTDSVPYVDDDTNGPGGALREVRAVLRADLQPRHPVSSVSADLEAIVAKATASEADQRYGSIQAFADDITRALEGRLVYATVERTRHLWRLAWRRYGTRLSAVGVAAVLTVGALLYGWAQTARAKTIVEDAYEAAQRNLYLAALMRVGVYARDGDHIPYAFHLLDSAAELAGTPADCTSAQRARLAFSVHNVLSQLHHSEKNIQAAAQHTELAKAFLSRFMELCDDQTLIDEAIAAAQFICGFDSRRAKDWAKAAQDFADAATRYERLARTAEEPAFLFGRAGNAWSQVTDCWIRLNDFEAAAQTNKRAHAAIEQAIAAKPDDLDLRLKQARTMVITAKLYEKSGEPAPRDVWLERAQATLDWVRDHDSQNYLVRDRRRLQEDLDSIYRSLAKAD